MTQELSDRTARRCSTRRRVLLFVVLLSGCSSFTGTSVDKDPANSPAVVAGPGKYHIRESQYVFYSDFPLKSTLPIFKELGELREQICTELQLPPSNTVIQVFLFENQEQYEKYMRSRYADLPLRRAFFIKQPRHTGGLDDLLVFTWWSDDIRKDLRHELTHGILHSCLKDVPLWLDEGLAELYELPPEVNGISSAHIDLIRKGPFRPDLAKLEQFSEVKQMQRPEYREAWAWAHFMLRGKPENKAVLLSYLQQLRSPTPPTPVLPKLKEVQSSPNEGLAEHLARLQSPGLVK